MRVALVLGAGGVVGQAYHATVLSALYRVTGWDPRQADLIVGTSAGSVVAALLRGGVAPADVLERVLDTPRPADVNRQLDAGQVPQRRGLRMPLPQAPWTALSQLTRPWSLRPSLFLSSLVPKGRLETIVIGERPRELFGESWPDDDLWVVSVELDSGKRVVHGRDEVDPPVDLGTAVESSCAIPGFFRPVNVNGTLHMDGAAHSSTNADVLVGAEEWDLVIVLAPMAGTRSAAFGTFPPYIREFFRRMLDAELKPLREAGVPILTFYPALDEARMMGFDLMDSMKRVPVVLQSGAEALRWLAEPRNSGAVEMLRAEGRRQRLKIVEDTDEEDRSWTG